MTLRRVEEKKPGLDHLIEKCKRVERSNESASVGEIEKWI
jgi:hypothetical protein